MGRPGHRVDTDGGQAIRVVSEQLVQPRVRVLEIGHLIDGTAIGVSDDEMQALRKEAFRLNRFR